METKKCKCCGRELPIEEFRMSRLGRYNTCNTCIKKHQVKARLDKKIAKLKGDEVEKAKKSRLAEFTPRELLSELKSRGYKWEKMSVTVVQEVDYNKV